MYREHRKKSREIMVPLITQVVEQGVKEEIFDIKFPEETVEYVGYILENWGDSLKAAQNENEYYRKVKALEIILSKIAGIEEMELNLVDLGKNK